MPRVHCDYAALLCWQRELQEFLLHLLENRRILHRRLESLEAYWNDRQYLETIDFLRPWMDRLEAAREGLDRQGLEAARVILLVSDYLTSPLAGEPVRREAARGSAATPPPMALDSLPVSSAPDPVPLASLPGFFRTRNGRSLRLVPPEQLRGMKIDWGSEDMRRDFYERTHHNNESGFYLDLLDPLEEVLEALKNGADPANDFFSDTPQKRAYDVFLGGDPIRIEQWEGSLNVIDGRHRLFAAMERGVSVPVEWIVVPKNATSRRSNLSAPI